MSWENDPIVRPAPPPGFVEDAPWMKAPIIVPAPPPGYTVNEPWANDPIVRGPWESYARQRTAVSVLEAIEAGYQGSATGLMLRGKLPDVVLDPHNSRWYEKAAASLAGIVSELPHMVGGFMAGTAAGATAGTAVAPGPGTVVGGIIGGGAGSFAVPAVISNGTG